jgi:hypothetical protein
MRKQNTRFITAQNGTTYPFVILNSSNEILGSALNYLEAQS